MTHNPDTRTDDDTTGPEPVLLDPATVTAEQIMVRVAPFADRCEYGPNYDRDIATSYHDTVRMVAAGRLAEAVRWLYQTELRGGAVDFDRYRVMIASLDTRPAGWSSNVYG